ncbi:HK97 family phage prohead protease [Collimonas fungivorans]|nr:HK97 family phage prohead protease [Collimonas fungivorans]
MLLQKTLKLNDVELKMDGETGKFTGYASVFGGVDSYGDTIVKGAFESTLRANGKPLMYLEHSWQSPFSNGAGLLPIGKFDRVSEDDHGLLVSGELTPGMSISADVRAAMLHGTIDGLSIGGYVKKGDYDEIENGRVIRKWTRLVEVSVTAMPADNVARISSVKSGGMDAAIAEVETVRDLEYLLRDAGGFSKGAAMALVARVKTLFHSGDPGEQGDTKQMKAILEKISRIAA